MERKKCQGGLKAAYSCSWLNGSYLEGAVSIPWGGNE